MGEGWEYGEVMMLRRSMSISRLRLDEADDNCAPGFSVPLGMHTTTAEGG